MTFAEILFSSLSGIGASTAVAALLLEVATRIYKRRQKKKADDLILLLNQLSESLSRDSSSDSLPPEEIVTPQSENINTVTTVDESLAKPDLPNSIMESNESSLPTISENLEEPQPTNQNAQKSDLENTPPSKRQYDHFINYLRIQERYYDTNLAQTRAVFTMGVILLSLGIAMIAAGVVMSLSPTAPSTIALLLTFSAGVLVDFLGTIFVAIHAKTLETASIYQKYISRVSNSLLAKEFITDITDPVLKQQALIDIAKNLCQVEN